MEPRKICFFYRGVNLSNDLIEQYRKKCAETANEKENAMIIFSAITSTSRNREKAEQFGNAVFVIEISELNGYDVSPYSGLNEEEQLVRCHFYLYIRSCVC